MVHLERGPAPEFWTWKQVREWTRRWIEKGHKSKDWKWPTNDGQTINNQAREAMRPWHHGKCAFCEAPLIGTTEIEHFRSKTEHPRVAFVWCNLFLICSACNGAKGVQSYERCLKPDRDDPTDYFWYNRIAGNLEPNPALSEEDQERAKITIERYRLDRPELRKLYECYLLKEVLFHSTAVVGAICQDGKQNEKTIAQAVARLKTLARPEQPYSVMVKSFLYQRGVS